MTEQQEKSNPKFMTVKDVLTFFSDGCNVAGVIDNMAEPSRKGAQTLLEEATESRRIGMGDGIGPFKDYKEYERAKTILAMFKIKTEIK